MKAFTFALDGNPCRDEYGRKWVLRVVGLAAWVCLSADPFGNQLDVDRIQGFVGNWSEERACRKQAIDFIRQWLASH